jgi:hypothetical protein
MRPPVIAARRVVAEDRWAVLCVLLATATAAAAWRATTRPMGDSHSYRVAGQVITSGWDQLTDRTPGYPLLLWATGSLDSETVQLFVVQAVLHAASVLLVVRVAARIGLPPSWRVVIALLLVLPPPMVKVVYSGSEALSELLVVLALWLFVRWLDAPRSSLLVTLGVVAGAAAWVRPTFQLLFVPLGVAVWAVAWRRPTTAMPAWRTAVLVAGPAALIVASLASWNAVRFDSPGLTPDFGWFLGSRTSAFVQELPASYEPLRSALIEERDRRLLLGPETDAENYLFGIEDEISRITGREGVELDRYVLSMNLRLIREHPFDYFTAVTHSAERYVQIDAEPAASGPGRWGGWLQSLAHPVLMLAFLIPAVTVPGLVLVGSVDRRTATVLAYCALVSLYVAAVSCLVQTGSPRLRAPTDPLLVLMGVAGWWILRRVVVERRAATGTLIRHGEGGGAHQ